ncbi:hypothetical protein [Aquisphaera insulae]|uniref:hypothetical protein n=1 Tax=Aquisphaera insulae TaxID=2712864 RepID=UPI0013EDB305|nr:hypothetical protein [Aquisphaera insulae]
MTGAELATIRLSLKRDRPYGADAWTRDTARLLGLEYSLRDRGRPRKTAEGGEDGGGAMTQPS